MKPQRIQLSRRRGWRMPPNTVSVARPGRWGNPFRVGAHGTAEECVRLFGNTVRGIWVPAGAPNSAEIYDAHQRWLKRLGGHPLERARTELAGKNLACWCGVGPCHADVLLEVANSEL